MSSITTPRAPETRRPTLLPQRTRHELPEDLPPNAGRAAAGIATVLVGQLMLILDATVVNVGLPRIDADLSFGPAALSWVLNAYTLAFGGLLLLGGRLGDVYGRRRMFELGVAVFTLASVAGGLAQSPGWLVASRAVQGVGAAMAAPGVLALLTTSAPDEAARHRALALFGAVSSGGMSIGLLLGGFLTDVGSWRWTLFINVPIGLAVLAATRRFLDETPARPGRFDVVGAVTATLGAVSLVWALIGAPEHGWWSVRTVGGFAFGVLMLVTLAVTERRVAQPMLQPALLRNRRRVAGLALMMLVVGGQFSMFFLVVQYTQRVLHLGPMLSGAAFLPLTLGIFTMSRLTPQLLARYGAQRLIVTGAAGLALSFVWLALVASVEPSGNYAQTIMVPMVLNGISAGLAFMPITSTILADVDPVHAGAASGLLQTAQQLGGAVGLATIASVYAANAVPGAFVPGLAPAFLTSMTMSLLALGVAAVALRRRTPVAAG